MHPHRPLLLVAALALSCAAGEKETRPGSETGSGEGDCLKRIAMSMKHFCADRPSELGEGYAARARESWDELDHACGGTRSRRALRDFDECVAEFEAQANQIDDETHARREEAAPKAAALKTDDIFQRALAKKRRAVDEADACAETYKAARRDQVEETELRFRMEEWDGAEKALLSALAELRAALRKHDLDPRDARALGLW